MVRVTKSIAKNLLTPFFRVAASGVENLPANTAFILLPKHQRWEDIPLLASVTPRPLYYVAKQELFKNPLGSWFMKSLGSIKKGRPVPFG
jgi:1-acyl-sn-glycerol-3-phosphate acyltransferase